ncbi:MAG: hypothetical protein ACKOI2_01670 [Actinomycetota bacterium]
MTDRTLRPQIPPPGSHGGDSWSLSKALKVDPAQIIDLSASMNPFAPPAADIIGRIVVDRPEVLARYPDEGEATKHPNQLEFGMRRSIRLPPVRGRVATTRVGDSVH